MLATRMNQMLFGVNQMQNNASERRRMEEPSFLLAFFNEKTLQLDVERSLSVRTLWTVSLEDIRSGPLLRNNPSPESDYVERYLKIFSRHAIMILLDLVTQTVLKVGQSYASHEVVLTVRQSGCVPDGIVSSLEKYDEQTNTIQNISEVENTIQRVLSAVNFEATMLSITIL